MNVWLTPNLQPFVGGTYFPPEDGLTRVGFRTVLLRIREQVGIGSLGSREGWDLGRVTVKGKETRPPPPHRTLTSRSAPALPQWKQNKNTLLENSQRVTTALLARSEISTGDRQLPPSAATMNSRCFQQLDEGYDEEYGGFAESPKFPTPGQCPR